jgi:hypothetical protein
MSHAASVLELTADAMDRRDSVVDEQQEEEEVEAEEEEVSEGPPCGLCNSS